MSTDTVRQLRVRRAAAVRLEGGDPWRRPEPAHLTAAQLSAWSAAANWIAADGVTPIIPREVLRLLWQRGGPDRQLAERIATNGGGR
ncbi:hypothetical protein ACFYUD_03725 [Nocardia tengchongensis]|uniref:hypothetical protein n=1 Tax=Nocardia tengchongensis TaxID=2055889 RepID=UPI0036C3C532